MIYPKKLKPGDKVAIVSPSGGLPEIFPSIYNQGLNRLQDIFGIIPVEYPTTKILDSDLKSRASDLNSAFLDPEIKAIICTIGGSDQIKLLKHLDVEIIKNNPKIFMGYSDATHTAQFITQNTGLVTFYGPAIMTQFGVSGLMDEYTQVYLKKALFESGEFEILPSSEYSENFLDWNNSYNLDKIRPMYTAPNWFWYNFKNQQITGQTWGGCLESIDYQLRVNKYLPEIGYFKDKIFFFETSEEVPSSDYVYRVLASMGERGLLTKFQAVLVGRSRSLMFGEKFDPVKVKIYQDQQREAIIKAFAEYAPEIPILFNLDFGHTDPIFSIPNGGNCRIDGVNKKLFFEY